MKHEIKFRAWDNDYKKMVHSVVCETFELGISFEGVVIGFEQENNTKDKPASIGVFPARFSPLQFTGLFDKNSKEIYEEDIVQQFSDDDPYFRYVVLFKNGAFGYQPHGEDYDFIPYAGNPHFKWNKNMSDKLEIIGNVYETPELIPKDAHDSVSNV